MNITKLYIGKRFRALRESKSLTQQKFASLLGFSDRQILSSIENGTRRVSADELIRAAEILEAPLEYFTDPFMLLGEGRFSWRSINADEKSLVNYERQAGRLIAAYRYLAPQVGIKLPSFSYTSRLNTKSTIEETFDAGERFAQYFNLGETPSSALLETIENELKVLVLMVEAAPGISGAACCLQELDTILIARAERKEYRNFAVAHELFHILTWDTMPPKHIDLVSPDDGQTKRLETPANKFAAALLMPSCSIQAINNWSNLNKCTLIDQIREVSAKFEVSPSALKMRLLELGELSKAQEKEISESFLNGRNQTASTQEPPLLFSRQFMEVMARSMRKGLVSTRRICDLLNLTMDEINEMLEQYAINMRIDL